MNLITFLIASLPITGIVTLFLCWDKPFFQNRLFRCGLGGVFLLLTAFCGFGALASFELPGAEGLTWRLCYLTLGALSTTGSLYFFFKRPMLGEQGARR